MEENNKPILEIRNLSVTFRMYGRGLARRDLEVISDLYFTARPGEITAIAGSSGSGKSVLASAVLGILPRNASVEGDIFYKNQKLDPGLQRKLRGKEIALVPQSVAYLDPLMKTGSQVDGCGHPGSSEKRKQLFRRLDLPPQTETLYPFQLSGGMARRILVSTALISDADLIIADEPTPGMSLPEALEALKMFREIADRGKAVILITHDIDLAFEFADRISVFYAGTIVETAPVSDFREGPRALRHPYSKALVRALPQNEFLPLSGFQPYAADLPAGCLFASRCPLYTEKCILQAPPVRKIRDGEVRCYYGS